MMKIPSESDRSPGDSSTPSANPADTSRPPKPATGPAARATAKARARPRPIEVLPPEARPPDPPDGSDADPVASVSQGSRPSPVAGHGQLVLTEAQWAQTAAHHELSPQQLAVVQHLFDDESGSGIAYLMGIEESCVRTYIRRIYEKLEVSGQVAMAARILEQFIAHDHENTDAGTASSPEPPRP